MATVQGRRAEAGLVRTGAAALAVVFSLAATAAETWHYSSSADTMRGQAVHRAELNSTTRINGDGAMTIMVRRSGAANRDEALLFLRNLLYSCGISDCAASVKFDDGPIKSIALTRSTDMSSSGLFVSKPAPFLKDLQKSKRLIVEVDVFRNGRRQFVFEDVSGLKLPDVAPAKKK